MVGFRSKRIMSVERYADPVTMDHIIELREGLRETERQREIDFVDQIIVLQKELLSVRKSLKLVLGGKHDGTSGETEGRR